MLFAGHTSSPSYFLELACDVTAVYEAMLMENFIACGVSFYVCTKARQKVEKKMGKEKMKNGVADRVYVCVVWGDETVSPLPCFFSLSLLTVCRKVEKYLK